MDEAGSFVSLLRPVLDTYMDAAVGLMGCRSVGLGMEGCEYDLLVVGPEHNPPATLRIGGGFVDLAFSTERELMWPRSTEIAVSLASMKPVRDSGLVLSTCGSAARESLERNYQRSAEERLASSLKAVGRAEEAISMGGKADADFWLTSAGYDFAYAWLHAAGTNPAPSHLLSQLRRLSRGQPGMFEAFSTAVGLQGASRAACEARLDALGVVYDLKELPRGGRPSASPESVRNSYELLRRKSMDALRASQPVDSFCFLGLEVVQSLPQIVVDRLGKKEASEVLAPLSGGENGLLAESVVKALGIGRSADAVEGGLRAVRSQVSALTRRA